MTTLGSPRPTSPALTMEDLRKYTVNDLRQHLKAAELSCSGTKEALVRRLYTFLSSISSDQDDDGSSDDQDRDFRRVTQSRTTSPTTMSQGRAGARDTRPRTSVLDRPVTTRTRPARRHRRRGSSSDLGSHGCHSVSRESRASARTSRSLHSVTREPRASACTSRSHYSTSREPRASAQTSRSHHSATRVSSKRSDFSQPPNAYGAPSKHSNF